MEIDWLANSFSVLLWGIISLGYVVVFLTDYHSTVIISTLGCLDMSWGI